MNLDTTRAKILYLEAVRDWNTFSDYMHDAVVNQLALYMEIECTDGVFDAILTSLDMGWKFETMLQEVEFELIED